MSTTYYQLKPPITSVRVEKADKYNKLHIWIAHQKAGTLLVSEHEVADLLLLFADYLKVALYTHFTKGELQIDPSDKGLPDSTCTISEYGELYTVKEIKNLRRSV